MKNKAKSDKYNCIETTNINALFWKTLLNDNRLEGKDYTVFMRQMFDAKEDVSSSDKALNTLDESQKYGYVTGNRY